MLGVLTVISSILGALLVPVIPAKPMPLLITPLLLAVTVFSLMPCVVSIIEPQDAPSGRWPLTCRMATLIGLVGEMLMIALTRQRPIALANSQSCLAPPSQAHALFWVREELSHHDTDSAQERPAHRSEDR